MSRKATNYTVLDQALVSGTNFITGLVLARILGADGYGLFILLSGVILFALNIQNAVIVSPMMVGGPTKEPDEARAYYQITAIMQLVVTLVFFTIIVTFGSALSMAFQSGGLSDLILPLALASSGLLLQEYFRRFFFTTKKPVQALINDSLSYGLQLIAILVLHNIYGLDVKLCLYAMALTSFIAVIHGILISGLVSGIRGLSSQAIKMAITDHWIFGKWLVAKNVTYWFGTQMVIYMTGIFLSVAAVGAMGAARNIVGISNILFLALDNFATPRASQIYAKQGIQGLEKYTKRLSILGGIATACIALTASLAPEFWLNLVYSDEYAGYGWLVIGWSIFFFIGYFQRPYGISLRVLNDTRSIFRGTIWGTIVALIIVYPALRYADLYGAIATLLVIQLIITAYYAVSYKNLATRLSNQ